MQNTDIQSNTASAICSAEDNLKARNRAKRLARIKKIRESLGDAASRLAYSVSEAAIACGRTPTWGYRRLYDGTFRVTNEGGRLMIPASEIAHFLAGASKYDPQPKPKKSNGDSNPQPQHSLGTLT